MIKTRFAPSPTGYVHVGNLRTALFAYLFAKKNNGVFALRLEDTDRTRYVEGAEKALFDALDWVGISIDEGVTTYENGSPVYKGDASPYVQSERLEIYNEHIQPLLEKGHAYYAFDSKEELDEMRKRQELNKQPTRYEKNSMRNQFTLGEEETKKLIDSGESYVIRMNMPSEGSTEFSDLIRGSVTFQNNEIDDQVLMKADGFPTYHFAVVVDDYLMGVTHVIRGEDWLSSTPKHIQLYKMFGWSIPTFAHLPLLVNEQKAKLSKRHGDVSVEDFKQKGYLPEALVNFVALLGWNPGDDREIFSLKELEEAFSIEKVGKSASVFNREKLAWFNQQYIRRMSISDLTDMALPHLEAAGFDVSDRTFVEAAVKLEQERMTLVTELPESLKFMFTEVAYEAELLVWKKSTLEDAKAKLAEVKDVLEDIDDYSEQNLNDVIIAWIKDKEYGVGDVLWPMRVALSGQQKSPGPFEIASVLGKAKTIERIQVALAT